MKDIKLTAPAKLTTVRMILLPMYMIALIYDFGLSGDGDSYTWPRIISAALFMMCVLVYYLDRFILKRSLGPDGFWSFIDIIADKYMTVGAMIAICFSDYILPEHAFYSQFFFWSAAIIMLREFIVLAILLKSGGDCEAVLKRSFTDRLRTAAYILCIIITVLEPIFFTVDVFRNFRLLSLICTVLAVALALYSGYKYIVDYYSYEQRHLLEEGDEEDDDED